MARPCPSPAMLLVACILAGASARGEDPAPRTPPAPFDGRSLAGWTTTAGTPVDGGWEIADGVIHLTRQAPRRGHILTADEFGDFDLTFEWKISPRGNSGIKYRVRAYDGRWLGCEYQMYDDEQAKKKNPKHMSGALYDLYAPDRSRLLRPAGEYNSGRIVVRGDSLEHWLNGTCVVSATVGDAEWDERIGASKFSDIRDFARNRRGRLMLTSHDGEAWFRVVRFVAE